MVRVVSLFLLLSIVLLGEENSPSLVNLTRQPIPRVFGTVNVISGDWVDQEVHEKPIGPDSLPIGHSYISSSLEEGTLSDGWDFFWPSTLEVYEARSSPNEYCSFLFLREGSGATLMFRKKLSKDAYAPVLDNSGYTHIASLDSPVLRDPKRITFREESEGKRWKVTLSDGTIRLYMKTNKKHRENNRSLIGYDAENFHIMKEVLPSKNIRLYEYDKHDELIEIKTISSCSRYLIQKITLTKEKKQLIAETLEGKKIIFSLKDINNGNDRIVNGIAKKGVPDRQYEYCEKSPRHIRRIERRTWSTGREEEAKFYNDSHDTTVNGEEIHQSDHERDFTKGRVREIRTKRFRGEELFIRNSFLYDKKGSLEYPIMNVIEPDDAATRFMFHDKRVIWISYTNAKHGRLAAEHFGWSKDGKLEERALFDREKNPIFVKEVVLDARGFPIEEKNHGLLTSKRALKIILDDHKRYEKGGETWGEKAEWDDTGRLLSRTDADGNWTYYEYDRSFITKKVVCAKKHILYRQFATYDTAGNLTELIEDDSHHREKENLEGATRRSILQIARRMKAPYFGEPESKKYYVWTPEGGVQRRKTEHFFRDGKGRLIRHTIRSYDGLEKETSFVYDDLDRPIETVLPDGMKETMEYDPRTGLVRKKSFPSRTVVYSYDLFDRVISEKETYTDGSFLEKTYDYDQSGRVVTMRDSRNRVEVVEKDLLGRIVSKKHSPIRTESGFVSPVETFDYSGNQVVATSPTGAVTKTLLSSIGKPLEVLHPEGHTTTFRYDMTGREIESFDGERRTRMTYDEKSHLVRKEVFVGEERVDWQSHTYQGDDLVQTESEGLLITYFYDAFGRCIETHTRDKISGKEKVEKKEYDGFDRVVKVISSQVEERTSYDRMDRIKSKKVISDKGNVLLYQKMEYDEAGRLIEQSILQDGHTWRTTKTTYGAYGLPSSIELPDGALTRIVYRQGRHSFIKKTINALGVATEEALDPNDVATRVTVFSPFGNKISEVRTSLTLLGKPSLIDHDVFYKGTLEESIRTLLEYDSNGRLTSMKEAVGTEEEVSTCKSYDAYGRCVEETHPSGIRIHQSYDGKGRLGRKTSSDGTIDISFSYTFHDLVEKAYDHVAKTETRRSYDGLGHMTKEVQSNGLKVRYDYSPEGRLETITLPDHSEVRYRYEGGVLHEAARMNGSSSYSFGITKRSSSGMILEAETPFSLGTLSYSYDRMGRPLSKTHASCSDTRTYDLLGRTTVRSIDGREETFQYDDLSQLISDNGRSRSYDSYYRLREKEGERLSVTRRQQCTALGKKRFSYDIDGRRIKDGSAHLKYDALGRLKSYTKEGLRETYDYDAFSRRMNRKAGDTEELYLWVGLHEVGTFSPDGSCLSFRMLAEGVGTEGEATLAVELDGTPYCALSDLSGNIRVLLSASGEAVHTASYSSFDRLETTGIACPWGFSSKRHDENTGYIHFLHRLYDPNTSSFLTQDPLGLEGGVNLYAYVKNNPLSLFDLFGLYAWDNGSSWGNNDLGSGYAPSYEPCGGEAFDHSWDSGASWGSNNLTSESYSRSYSAAIFGPPDTPPSGAGTFLVGPSLTPVYAGTYYPSDFFSPTYGHNFMEMFRNAVSGRIAVFTAGVDTTKYGAIVDTNFMRSVVLFEEKRIKQPLFGDVANFYIETKGWPLDFLRAWRSFEHITPYQIRAANSYEKVLKAAQQYETATHTTIELVNFVHSRGGIDFSNVYKELVRRDADYARFFGETVSFGSTKTFQGGYNYWAKGDVVPALNPYNIPNLILHHEDIHVVDYPCQSPLDAHEILGPAYRQAFREYIHQKAEGL